MNCRQFLTAVWRSTAKGSPREAISPDLWPFTHAIRDSSSYPCQPERRCVDAESGKAKFQLAVSLSIVLFTGRTSEGKQRHFVPVPPTEPTSHRTHCPAPAIISNGFYLTDRQSETPLALPVSERGEQYEPGTIARYHCQDGYTIRWLHGQIIYRCLTNGEWSPKVPPACIKVEQNTYNGKVAVFAFVRFCEFCFTPKWRQI